jgi:hypothetical protein
LLELSAENRGFLRGWFLKSPENPAGGKLGLTNAHAGPKNQHY